jgi:hypothetical protein
LQKANALSAQNAGPTGKTFTVSSFLAALLLLHAVSRFMMTMAVNMSVSFFILDV